MRLSEARDAIAYVQSFASSLPRERVVDYFARIEKAIEHQVSRCSKKPDKHGWFVMALQEVREAFQAFESGDTERYWKLLDDASWHISDASKRRASAPRFIVGPEGTVQDVRPDEPTPQIDDELDL